MIFMIINLLSFINFYLKLRSSMFFQPIRINKKFYKHIYLTIAKTVNFNFRQKEC